MPVYDLVSAGNFEGGDFNMLEPGVVLIGYTGMRGEEVAARQVGGWMTDEGLEVKYAPIDEYYVHIDLMVCMLAEKLAAVCLDTTDPDIVRWIEGRGIEIVPVGFRETMALGCNVVALGGDRVLSTHRGTRAERAAAGARLRGVRPGYEPVPAGRRRRALHVPAAAPRPGLSYCRRFGACPALFVQAAGSDGRGHLLGLSRGRSSRLRTGSRGRASGR